MKIHRKRKKKILLKMSVSYLVYFNSKINLKDNLFSSNFIGFSKNEYIGMKQFGLRKTNPGFLLNITVGSVRKRFPTPTSLLAALLL